MAGFPATPTRDSFGPKLANVIPVRDDTRQLGADAMNLAFWQLAGAGRTTPQATLVYDPTANGGDGGVVYQRLAWDPRQQLAQLASVKVGVGHYTITFESTYLDERGVAVGFTPRAAMPSLASFANPEYEVRVALSGLELDVKVFAADGSSSADASAFVVVWG